MYEGTNTKALQSQQWLSDALLKLMRDQPYAKITIQDICREADLSRQTFYNVFGSKDEILHFYLHNACEECFRLLSDEEVLTVERVVDSFIYVVEHNREVLSLMIANQLNGIISEEITNAIRYFSGRLLRFEERDKPYKYEYAAAMLAGALSQLLLFWLTQEDPISMEEFTDLVRDFLNGEIYKFPV